MPTPTSIPLSLFAIAHNVTAWEVCGSAIPQKLVAIIHYVARSFARSLSYDGKSYDVARLCGYRYSYVVNVLTAVRGMQDFVARSFARTGGADFVRYAQELGFNFGLLPIDQAFLLREELFDSFMEGGREVLKHHAGYISDFESHVRKCRSSLGKSHGEHPLLLLIEQIGTLRTLGAAPQDLAALMLLGEGRDFDCFFRLHVDQLVGEQRKPRRLALEQAELQLGALLRDGWLRWDIAVILHYLAQAAEARPDGFLLRLPAQSNVFMAT